MCFNKRSRQRGAETVWLIKIHSDTLNSTRLTKHAAAWALQSGFQITSPDFTGRLCVLDSKAKVGVAVDVFGNYELYQWIRKKREKLLTQKQVDKVAELILMSGFVEIDPFIEFSDRYMMDLDAEQTEFIDELIFIPSELLKQNKEKDNGQKRF